jgi:hypothetical protein
MSEKLIIDIVKSATKIPLTTLVKTLKLDPEIRNTDVSLSNLKKIQKSEFNFKPTKISFYFKKNDPRLHTEWISDDDIVLVWDFRGFNAGYSGEGPNGLVKALKMLGIKDWDIDIVSELKPGRYKL